MSNRCYSKIALKGSKTELKQFVSLLNGMESYSEKDNLSKIFTV